MTRLLATSCLGLLSLLASAEVSLGRPVDWSDGNQRLAFHHSGARFNPTIGDESQKCDVNRRDLDQACLSAKLVIVLKTSSPAKPAHPDIMVCMTQAPLIGKWTGSTD